MITVFYESALNMYEGKKVSNLATGEYRDKSNGVEWK